MPYTILLTRFYLPSRRLESGRFIQKQFCLFRFEPNDFSSDHKNSDPPFWGPTKVVRQHVLVGLINNNRCLLNRLEKLDRFPPRATTNILLSKGTTHSYIYKLSTITNHREKKIISSICCLFPRHISKMAIRGGVATSTPAGGRAVKSSLRTGNKLSAHAPWT